MLSMRAIPGKPGIDNIRRHFPGLGAQFAAHLAPWLAAFLESGTAGVLGSLAGRIAHAVQRRLARA
jgi:hypothetical protein